jgi:hypothetical protein
MHNFWAHSHHHQVVNYGKKLIALFQQRKETAKNGIKVKEETRDGNYKSLCAFSFIDSQMRKKSSYNGREISFFIYDTKLQKGRSEMFNTEWNLYTI